jgi:hypothetical protein
MKVGKCFYDVINHIICMTSSSILILMKTLRDLFVPGGTEVAVKLKIKIYAFGACVSNNESSLLYKSPLW